MTCARGRAISHGSLIYFVRGLGCASIVTAAPFAHAQLVDISHCTGIAQEAQRLACYDALAKLPIEETHSPESSQPQAAAIRSVDPLTASVGEYVPPQERFRQKSRSDADGSAVTSEPEIVTKLRRHQKLASGKIAVELANGQVWRQTDSRHVRILEGQSLDVRIEKSTVGGYWMKIDRAGSAVRVERVK